MCKVVENRALRRWMLGTTMALSVLLSITAFAAEGPASQELAPQELAPQKLAPQKLYEQAKEFLRQGQAAQAFALLAAQEGELSGEDEFDYLFGVAALDSQQAGEAIFSLQRLVARKANFSGARLELARAYFDVGDDELASVEFARVLTENPPANVVDAVTSYQEAIKIRTSAYKTTTQLYFESGGGYDGNALSATDEQIFLGFQLSENNLAKPSAFAKAALGGFINRPLTEASTLLFTGRLDHRSTPSTHFIDSSNLDLGVAWNWNEEENSFSLAANNLFSMLDREYSRRDAGLMATYLRQVSKTFQMSTFARGAVSRFNGAALSVRDVNQTMLGVSAVKTFSASQVSLSLTKSADTTVDSASPFSTDGFAVSLGSSWFRPNGVQYIFGANFSRTDYDDEYFGFTRQDDTYGVTASGVWPDFPAKNWVMTAQVNYGFKHSTVSLFEFDRLETGVSFRKTFD
jgi:outer membrane protein